MRGVGFGGAWWFGWLCLVSGFGSLVSLVFGWLILGFGEGVARAIFRLPFSIGFWPWFFGWFFGFCLVADRLFLVVFGGAARAIIRITFSIGLVSQLVFGWFFGWPKMVGKTKIARAFSLSRLVATLRALRERKAPSVALPLIAAAVDRLRLSGRRTSKGIDALRGVEQRTAI